MGKKKQAPNLPAITRKALKALENAVAKVVVEHRARHLPLIVWENGRVIKKNLSRVGRRAR